MTPRDEAPDVDQLARSMLRLYGAHDDDDDHGDNGGGNDESWAGIRSKPPNFASAPTVPPRYGKRLSVIASGT